MKFHEIEGWVVAGLCVGAGIMLILFSMHMRSLYKELEDCRKNQQQIEKIEQKVEELEEDAELVGRMQYNVYDWLKSVTGENGD